MLVYFMCFHNPLNSDMDYSIFFLHAFYSAYVQGVKRSEGVGWGAVIALSDGFLWSLHVI